MRRDSLLEIPQKRFLTVMRLTINIIIFDANGCPRTRPGYDPWHYLPVLMKKPGALRNGAPNNLLNLLRFCLERANPLLGTRHAQNCRNVKS